MYWRSHNSLLGPVARLFGVTSTKAICMHATLIELQLFYKNGILSHISPIMIALLQLNLIETPIARLCVHGYAKISRLSLINVWVYGKFYHLSLLLALTCSLTASVLSLVSWLEVAVFDVLFLFSLLSFFSNMSTAAVNQTICLQSQPHCKSLKIDHLLAIFENQIHVHVTHLFGRWVKQETAPKNRFYLYLHQ